MNKSYVYITDPQKRLHYQRLFEEHLKSFLVDGNKATNYYLRENFKWSNEFGFWYVCQKPTVRQGLVNGFGLESFANPDAHEETVQINILTNNPHQSSGAFIEAPSGSIYIARTRGSSHMSIDDSIFTPFRKTVLYKNKPKEVLLVAPIDSPELPKLIYRFLLCVEAARSGHEVDQKEIEEISVSDIEIEEELEKQPETERLSTQKQRIGQDKLRRELLSEYENTCAMCSVNDPRLLRASHILQWSSHKEIRLKASNAILLCGLHDLAFENNLITINDKYEIEIKTSSKGVNSVLNHITSKHLRMPKHKINRPNLKWLLIKQKENIS